jgi:uracil-DNA glycosylase family 4
MDKKAQMEELRQEMIARKDLPLQESNLVFGEGNLDCDVMFIGEAPGANEDRLGRPFVGRGGQLVDTMIEGLGWKRADTYITNIVKRRPPENRDPFPQEIEAYKPYLTKQIEIIKPKLIVTLGRFAMNYFVPDAKISRDHGRPLNIDGQKIFPVYHPAAALRSTEMMNVLREDFKKIPKVLAGELTVEIPTIAIADARPAPKPSKPSASQKEHPKQGSLF